MKKHYGFTLSEALVTLAIMGVVASTVLPQLSKNLQEREAAVVLGRVMSQIEVGCQNLIQMANGMSTDGSYTDVLSTIKGTDIGLTSTSSIVTMSVFPDAVRSYWGLSQKEVTNIVPVQSYSGGSASQVASGISAGKVYTFEKFPAGVCITPTTAVTPQETGLSIYIDTNGFDKKPNKTGKDIFVFKLMDNGKMIPDDSKTKKIIKNGFRSKM